VKALGFDESLKEGIVTDFFVRLSTSNDRPKDIPRGVLVCPATTFARTTDDNRLIGSAPMEKLLPVAKVCHNNV
jgi:hypothetical protein